MKLRIDVMNALESKTMNTLGHTLNRLLPCAAQHLARVCQHYFSGRAQEVNPLGHYAILRPTAFVTVVSMLALITSPAVQALQSAKPLPEKPVIEAIGPYNQTLEQLRTSLHRNDAQQVARLRAELRHQAPAVVAELEHNRHTTPDALTKTGQDYSSFFEMRHEQLMGQLDYALQAPGRDQAQAFAAADALLKDVGRGIRANAKDFTKLAWRVEPSERRQPMADAASLAQWLAQPTEALSAAHRAQQAKARAEKSSLATSSHIQAVAKPLDLPATPSADDLAATVDVQITDAIKAKAAALHNNPVEIYNWVRNNIAYFPSYGSAQGSQMTLDKLQGNDADTASLLIALYRAAGIPARYVYGTVDIPSEQAMNWVGGAKTIDAAQQIIGQGGVPNQQMIKGGKAIALRIEHVWVEAYVDFTPSQGAINRHPDTWVPVDASFKQYQFSDGMDLQTLAPFDANAFLAQAQQGATINTAEGSVQNLNQMNTETVLKAYLSKLPNAIQTQKSDATVGDVLGKIIIPAKTNPYLYASLPYKTVAVAAHYSTLPSKLRHQFYYSLYQDSYARSIENSLFDYQADLPTLAGKKVTLAFVPVNDAAAKAIQAMLPKPHADGSPIQPSELPTTFSNHIHVKAQLRVEGQTVAEGGDFGMGDELAGRGGFSTLDLTDVDLSDDDTLIAGQQSAIGISVFGVSAAQLKTLQTRMQDTRDKLTSFHQNQNANVLDSIDGESITGDLLSANVWSYFASLQAHGQIASLQAGITDNPGLSYGLFHIAGKPNKLYGIVTIGFSLNGVMADIGHVRHMRWVKDDDPKSAINQPLGRSIVNPKEMAKLRWISYNRMRGQYASALEHAIPEQVFNNKSQCGQAGQTQCQEAISAAKAIQIAVSEGQKIFTITQANIMTVLPKITSGNSVIDEIQNAVATGKEVTIHEKPIRAFGWSGTGYIVIDPQTGTGAYLIEGGANGAYMMGFGSGVAVGGMIGLSIAGLFNGDIKGKLTPGVLEGVLGEVVAGIVALQVGLLIGWSALDAMQGHPWKSVKCYCAGFLQGLLLGLSLAAAAFKDPVWSTAVGIILGYLATQISDKLGEALLDGENSLTCNANIF